MLSLFRRTLDPVGESYRCSTPRRFRKRTPLEELRLIALDAETTGFRIGADRMLTLACADVSGCRIQLRGFRAWLFFQPGAPLNEAVAVHGILPSETAAGQPEKEVLAELLPVLSGAVLIGHHVAFDASMLDHALRVHFGTRLRNPLVDTGRLAMSELEAFRKTAYPNQRPPSLEEVCSNLGLPMHERHTAAGDTFTTAQVFLLLVARARRRLARAVCFGDLQARPL